MTIRLTINGEARSFEGDAGMPLLWYLRDHAQLTGTKFGCGIGACGACTVLVDGVAMRACVTPVQSVAERSVTTIEGLARDGKLHPVQQAWIDEDVAQCGYCQAGQILAAVDLLKRKPQPTTRRHRVDHQPLPLRHLRADPARHRARRAHYAADGGRHVSSVLDRPLARRTFLQVSLTSGGALLLAPVSTVLAQAGDGAPAKPPANPLGLFVRIEPDNRVIIGARNPEIGQGVKTAVPMILAEELDVAWSQVTVEQLPLGVNFGPAGTPPSWKWGPQGAGGSTSIPDAWADLRQVGAQGRWLMRAAAAREWQARLDDVSTDAGHVVHVDGRRTSYGRLVAIASTLTLPTEPLPLKGPGEYRIIGTRAESRGRGRDRDRTRALRDRRPRACRADRDDRALPLFRWRHRGLRRQCGRARCPACARSSSCPARSPTSRSPRTWPPASPCSPTTPGPRCRGVAR